jgi:hypothetical protein
LGSKALGLSSTCKNCYENSSTFRNNLWVWSIFFKFASNLN